MAWLFLELCTGKYYTALNVVAVIIGKKLFQDITMLYLSG